MQYNDIPAVAQEKSEILPTKKALTGGMYIITGKIISFLASFAVVTVMGRVIPRDVAGSYNYIIALFTIISITTLPGMNNALARATARGEENIMKPMLERRLLFGLIGSVISLVIGFFMWHAGRTELGFAFIVVAPFVPLTDTFSNFAMSYWQGKKRFDKSALVGASYYVGLALLSIPVLLLSDNLLVILFGILSVQTLMGILVYQTIRQDKRVSVRPSFALGTHLTVMQGFKIISSNIDRVIVWHLLGPAMVAIYSFAATPITKAYQLIPIGTVALPHLSSQRFTHVVKKQVLKKMSFLFLISIPVTLGVILIAPLAYKILFPLYPESVGYFQILALSLALAPSMLLKSALTAFHKTRLLYVSETATPLIKIALMLALGIAFGLKGIVGGIVLASCSDFCITFIQFLRAKTEIQ